MKRDVRILEPVLQSGGRSGRIDMMLAKLVKVSGRTDDNHLVLELKRAINLTIFLVEQDVRFIKTVADRCYVLEQGRIIGELSRPEFADSNRLEDYLAL